MVKHAKINILLGRDEVLDVISAGEFLKQDPRTQGKPVFVWAFSMGAVAAIGAQAQRPLFEAMILDCPYDSTENLVHTALNKVINGQYLATNLVCRAKLF